MNNYYAFIFFAFILLFLNSSLAHPIDSHPHEQYQKNVPVVKIIMVVPAPGDIAGQQYALRPLHQVPDQRARRGWGSG